jgi:phosphoglycerate dehydrogenase-like enzyme
MQRPKVWYLPPESHTRLVFRPESYRELLQRYDVRATEGERLITTAEAAQEAWQFDAIVTGWSSPPFSEEGLAKAEGLRIVAHSAGSVKHLFSERIVREILQPRAVVVFSANRAIAHNVAEATIGYLIAFSRRWFDQVQVIRASDGWSDPAIPKTGRFLTGATVGLISASTVGREVIRLLQPFDTRILVYDPQLTPEEACDLGVERLELDEVFAGSDFVSIHAPSIPATRQMVGRRQLRLLREGALLANTSRGSVVDHDALVEEARSGRFQVVLDVTEPEPLPAGHPLRRLPNVYVTPHVSGAGEYGYLRIGDTTLAALDDCFAGRPVAGRVDLGRWDLLA